MSRLKGPVPVPVPVSVPVPVPVAGRRGRADGLLPEPLPCLVLAVASTCTHTWPSFLPCLVLAVASTCTHTWPSFLPPLWRQQQGTPAWFVVIANARRHSHRSISQHVEKPLRGTQVDLNGIRTCTVVTTGTERNGVKFNVRLRALRSRLRIRLQYAY